MTTPEQNAACLSETMQDMLQHNPEYRRLERDVNTFEWIAESYEAEWTERKRACSERRQQWGDDDCDEEDSSRGGCTECSHDIAEFFETDQSKRRRAEARNQMDALAAALLKDQTNDRS